MRAGIVGFGGMGQRHYRAYAGTDLEVVAVCDQRSGRVREAAPELRSDQIYDDVGRMLEQEPLDLLSVVSNGPTHAEITVAALEAGVPRILCEKPMATSLAEAERVIDATRRTGGRVSVNHIRRWSGGYARLLERLRSGEWGELRHVYFHSGSTGLGNFVIHAFDLMRYLTGAEPAWVAGALDPTGTTNPRGAQFSDPAGYGLVMFDNGCRGLVDSGEDTGVQYFFTLATTYARIVIDELNGEWTVRARSPEDRAAPLTRYGLPMTPVDFDAPSWDIVELTRAALVELAGDGPISSTPEDGLAALEMVVAFHESERRGNARVDLPLTGEGRELVVPIG